MSQRRGSFFLYAQHLSGVGHFVRMLEIARALAGRHDVVLTDGGRPLPRLPRSVHYIELPRLIRGPEGITPLDPKITLKETMALRGKVLGQAIARSVPQAILIEHFPFSKSELQEEIFALLNQARKLQPQVKVFCSLRDICLPTRHDLSGSAWEERVIRILEAEFDGILVHSDPQLIPLETSIPWAGRIPIPIHYTGIVSEKPTSPQPPRLGVHPEQRTVIASAGGAADDGFLLMVRDAWQELSAAGDLRRWGLFIYLPLSETPNTRRALEQGLLSDAGIQIKPFAPGLVDVLQGSERSISRAGYNTCANLLESGTRGVLVPDPRMSDQKLRANIFDAHGLARAVPQDTFGTDTLRTLLEAQPHGNSPRPTVSIDGAQQAATLLEHHLLQGT